jgi:hypothetical protein
MVPVRGGDARGRFLFYLASATVALYARRPEARECR